MKLAFTFKPIGMTHGDVAFSGLGELDLSSGLVTRVLRLPGAPVQVKSNFTAPIACGLCIYGNTIYVALWNFVVVIDLISWSVIDAFSHPEMADLHSVSVDVKHIYAVSTALERLLVFRKNDRQLINHWGPNADILKREGWGVLPPLKSSIFRRSLNSLSLKRFALQPKYGNEDVRLTHKTVSPYYRHHLNEITLGGDMNRVYLNAKGWFGTDRGAVIELDTSLSRSKFLAPPGSLNGPHDGVISDGKLFVTESGSRSVASIDLSTKKIERTIITNQDYFVRGLCKLSDERWAVGLTPNRGTSAKAGVGILAKGCYEVETFLELPDLFEQRAQVAIHGVVEP